MPTHFSTLKQYISRPIFTALYHDSPLISSQSFVFFTAHALSILASFETGKTSQDSYQFACVPLLLPGSPGLTTCPGIFFLNEHYTQITTTSREQKPLHPFSLRSYISYMIYMTSYQSSLTCIQLPV